MWDLIGFLYPVYLVSAYPWFPLVSREFPRPIAQLKEHEWPEDAAWNGASTSRSESRFACCRAAWLPATYTSLFLQYTHNA